MDATINTTGIESIEIIFKYGRWTVNDKRLEDMDHNERIFMNAFFREVKILQPESKKRINLKQLLTQN